MMVIEAINDLTKSSPETLSGIATIVLAASIWNLIKNQHRAQADMLREIAKHPEYTELAKRLDELRNDVDRVEATVIELKTILKVKLHAGIE